MILALALSCDPTETSFQNVHQDVEEASGVAAVELSHDELAFTEMQPGLAYSMVLTIGSVGEAELLVTDVRVVEDEHDVFYLSGANSEDPSAELAPGTSTDYVFAATLPEGIAEAEARLRIKTNDPDRLDFYLPMSASAVSKGDTGDTGGKDTGAT